MTLQNKWRSRGLWSAFVSLLAAGAVGLAVKAPQPSKASPSTGEALTLAEVMRRTHFAFRESPQGFTGAHTTYTSRVEAGRVELSAASAEAEPLRLGATEVRRGDALLSKARAAWRRNPDGTVSAALGELEEQLENGPEGLEQRWRFERAPAGRGPLEVRVAARAEYQGSDAQGLRLAVGALAYRYSHATWVDATGARTAVPARWADGAIALTVPAEVLDASAWPAVLDPLVSAEIALDPPTVVAAPGNQDTAAIAWNGSQYLAVWVDGRGPGGAARDIYGTRLNAAGAPLDPYGILIAISTASAAAPAVASNGTDFMVVFTQDNGQNARVNAARVTAAGVALDTVGATIADPGPDTSAELPAIAWSGTSYLVVWGQYDVASTTATTVEGVRIDQNHTPLGAPFNIGLAGGGVAQTPDVDWDGSNYLVVWRQTGTLAGLYARRVSAAGVPAASSFAVSSTGNPLVPSVAWNGATHLVVWQNGATGTGDIYGARVPATGSTVTDPSGFVISNATGAQDAPDVTAAGSTFYVAWHDTRGGGAADIYGAQVSGTTVTPAAGTAISAAASNQLWVALGSDGSNVMSVWSDYRNAGTSDLYGTLINAAGAVQTPAGTRLSTAGNTELTPAVAFDGTNYLVVWEDQRGAASDVYGVRVSPAGVPLDATAIAISTAANNQKAPAVAWAGSNYLVVWQDDRTALGVFDVYAARVSAAGAVLDATGVPVSAAANNQQAPAVAYDGTNALVVWEDDRTTAGTFHIFGARVSGAGAVLDAAGVAISQGARAERRPAIGWNGATYFVAYENMNLSSQWDITGRIVSSSVVAAAARTYAAASALNFRYHPALGASGATFLLAWEALSGSDIDVVGMRVDGAGNGVLTIQLGTGPQAQSYPAVAGDGTNFQVVWQDATNGATNRDLYGRRVSAATGALLDASPFVVSNGSTDELAPALASSGSRAFLVAYQAFAVGPNAARARARTLANAPPTATPTSASVAEDGVLTPLVLTGTDADADTLSFAIVSPPTHGTLSGAAPSVTYTPALNYAGPDSFTFKVNDGVVDSAPGTVSLTVTPVNDLPVPAGQAASVQEDTPKAITLTGSDVEGSPLTFAVVNPPTHGSLSGSAPNLTYSPAPDYNGPDSFTFKVNDGTADSAGLATVTITVVAVNDAPTAIAQNTNTPEDTAKAITLNGTDVEGSALTYQIVAQPPFGTLSGTPPNLTYTPNLNFNGTDSFQFTVNDGALTSAPAQVNVLVQPVNDAPLAQGQAVGTPQDTAVSVTLVGTDVDNNPLTYVIVAQPMHGTLSAGTSATRTYTPTPGYQGGDSFTFKVNDGTVDSNVATVTVSVSSVNHAPTASAQGVTTPEDQSVAITLTGADSDGDPLNYTVTVPPLHGSLTGSGSARTYTPTLNYNGPDSFTFRVNDGQVDSPPAVVSITVSPVNDAPTAAGQNVSTQEDTPLAVTLTGADLDGNPLTFAVVLQPMHGALSGTPPNLTYTPAANYNGFDVFSFKANDGTVDSAAAANVQIVVATVNDAPVAQAQMVMTNQDTAKVIALTATDVDMDFLVYSIVAAPAHGAVMGTPPNVTYVPSAGYRGTDVFTFKASDGQQDSAPATVSIAVASVNHAPVVTAPGVTLAEDTDAGITVMTSDQDGDPVTLAVVDAPAHGTLSGVGPQYDYRPNPDFTGVDFFTVKGNDGFVDSSPPTRINLTVTPVNDAPVALMQEVNGSEDLPVTIVLAGRDVDGDGLTFRVATAPTHGSLSGNAPNLTFTPQANDSADDTFTFVVNDGTVDSAPATVTVHLQPVNDAPVAQALTFTTSRDVPVEVTLSASDLDGDGLTFEVAAAPSNGTLSGTAPDLTYTPNSGFTGSDSFTYRASDGSLASTPAMVTLTVSGDNQSVPKETYARVNGWTCGCGQTGFAPGLLGLSWLLLRKRRRGGRVAQVALAVVLVAATAWAKPAPKKKGKAAAPAAAVEAPAPAPATVVEPEPTAPAPAAPVVVTAPQPQGPPSLAALEVAVTVPSEKLDGSAFTEMLVSAIAQSGLFKVISASEVATLLGVERQRQLMGCGEDSCLAEISDALGAQYLLQGAVGKVGDNYLVTVRLLDSRRSVVVGRSALQTTDVGLLLSLVWRATNETVDAAANGLSGPERERWLARPREEPAAAVPPAKVKFGIAVTAVGGYQPRADPGYRASFGGEVDLTLRVARLDLGAGVVVSPSPGGRVSVTIALLAARNRVALGARGVYFPGARLGGGGVVATYEFLLSSIFGVRALVAAEAYAGAPSVVLALLGGIGVEAHF